MIRFREYKNIQSDKEKNNTAYNQKNTQNVAIQEELKQVNVKRKKTKEQLKQEEAKVIF